MIYNFDETSKISVYGKGKDVVKVITSLQQELDSLAIKTLSVTKDESKFLLDYIKEIKS